MGYNLFTWKAKAGQHLAGMKKDPQSMNYCHTTKEEARLIVFNVIQGDVDGQS